MIDNSFLRVGQQVLLERTTHFWMRDVEVTTVVGEITKITSSRIYVTYTYSPNNYKSEVVFEYRKTKRLKTTKGNLNSDYVLYTSEEEYVTEKNENSNKMKKNLQKYVHSQVSNRLNEMTLDELKELHKVFQKYDSKK